MNRADMKSIFSGVKNKKTNNKSYEFIQKALDRGDITGTCDLSHIAKWLEQKYKKTYNVDMIDYNFYNSRKAIQSLASRYSKTNWQICTYINKWFTTFHTLGYDKVAYDDTVTLSVLKTSWVVDGLYNNKLAPKQNTRNKSYKVHSQSRRTVTNNDEIINEAF